MKTKTVTAEADKVTIHHASGDYVVTCEDWAVKIPPDQIGGVPPAIALILILLDDALKLWIVPATYFPLRDKVGLHVDLCNGGLTAAALKLFGDDCAVVEAAEMSCATSARRNKKLQTASLMRQRDYGPRQGW